jgi:hypothetical protein
MPPIAAFGISVVFSLIAWGVVAARYIWPELRRQNVADALRPILILHSFRFLGLAFIVPGVISPDLPIGFARMDAYGDFVTAILAMLALAALRSRLGLVLVWVFNVWGTVDLLNAFYQGNRHGMVPGQLGAAYFIVTLFVPLLLITHALIFRLLTQRDSVAAARDTAIDQGRGLANA